MREREGRCGTSEPCARIAWYKNWEFELFFSAFFDFFPPYPSPVSCHFLCPLNYFRPYINSCLLLLFESVFFVFVYCLRHNTCLESLHRPESLSMPTLYLSLPRLFSFLLSFFPRSYALSFFLFLLILSFSSVLSRCSFPFVMSPVLSTVISLVFSLVLSLCSRQCSWSGSLHHQAKVTKNFTYTVLIILYDFLSLKNEVNVR
jgi:hypothetical protein